MASAPSPFSSISNEQVHPQQRVANRPAWNYFSLCLLVGMLASYVYHLGTELSFMYLVNTWYVPVVSALVICWVPWVVGKMTQVDTLEKLFGLSLLMGFIGWDMIRRVAYTFYQVGMWGC